MLASDGPRRCEPIRPRGILLANKSIGFDLNATKIHQCVWNLDFARGEPTVPKPEERLSARIQVVKSQIDREWDEREKQELQERVLNSVEFADRLRNVPLSNADTPDVTFTPFKLE